MVGHTETRDFEQSLLEYPTCDELLKMDEGLADEDPLGLVLRPSTTLIRTMVEDKKYGKTRRSLAKSVASLGTNTVDRATYVYSCTRDRAILVRMLSPSHLHVCIRCRACQWSCSMLIRVRVLNIGLRS